MILKGIISSYPNEDNKIKIRIPRYHRPVGASGYTPLEDLPDATVISMPGIKPQYIPGDIVYVDFENDDLSKPCIIGKLNYPNDTINSVSNAIFGDITVQSVTKLSPDTTIGKIQSDDLQYTVQGFINLSSSSSGGMSDYYYRDDGFGNISVIYYT